MGCARTEREKKWQLLGSLHQRIERKANSRKLLLTNLANIIFFLPELFLFMPVIATGITAKGDIFALSECADTKQFEISRICAFSRISYTKPEGEKQVVLLLHKQPLQGGVNPYYTEGLAHITEIAPRQKAGVA